MSHLYEDDMFVDALANEALRDSWEHQEEVDALLRAIDELPDPRVRRILRKLVEMSA